MKHNKLSRIMCVSLSILFLQACSRPEQKLETAPVIASEIDEICVANKFDYLRLDVDTFDQDQDKGWRKIAHTDGCTLSAAALINEYRTFIIAEKMNGLIWHEAQLRAIAGETEQAIFLFRQTHTSKQTGLSNAHYRDATIAFLEQSKAELLAARKKLSELPKPQEFAASVDRYKQQYPERTPPEWPPNLNIVDSFIVCFNKPYKEAYSSACRQKH